MVESSGNSRTIPVRIKRQLRQESAFGCRICGNPIIEYHHIVPYSECLEHDPSNMLVLCPTCHRKVGKWTHADQLQIKKKQAVNLQRGYVNGLLYIAGRKLAFDCGGTPFVGPNIVTRTPAPGKPCETLIGARTDDDGHVLLTAKLIDECDLQLLHFVDNTFHVGIDVISDFRFKENCVDYKSKDGQWRLQLDFRSQVGRITGRFPTPIGPISITEKDIHVERTNDRITKGAFISANSMFHIEG